MMYAYGSRRVAGIFAIAACLTGCEAAENIAPEISDIVGPQDGTNLTTLVSTATVDRKGWAYANVYFTFALSPETLFDTTEAGKEDADCTPRPDEPTVLDCQVSFIAPPDTWYYQWHIDYGQSGADTAVLSRPVPPEDTFVVTVPPIDDDDTEDDDNGNGPDGDPVEPDPNVPENDELVLFDPSDGDQCVGTFVGFDIETGTVTAPINWRTESTGEYVSIGGNYQVMVEHPDSPNCGDAGTGEANDGLNLDVPNAAWAYQESGGCYVVAANTNASATPALRANHDYRVRVRRILSAGGFGGWTSYNTFRTASPPPEPPTLIEPASDTVDMPNTVEAQTVEMIWRVPGCPATSFTLLIYQDDADMPNPLIEGVCNWNNEPDLCHASTVLDRGHSYRVDVTQSNAFGTITGEFNFTTE